MGPRAATLTQNCSAKCRRCAPSDRAARSPVPATRDIARATIVVGEMHRAGRPRQMAASQDRPALVCAVPAAADFQWSN